MEMIGIHPHVVEILGTAEDCRVFVMERAASDLYTIVKQQERNLPLQLAKLWSGHMLAAVQYMHVHGVVHQDIKSSNVLIFSDRSAKICDFGLARRVRAYRDLYALPVCRRVHTFFSKMCMSSLRCMVSCAFHIR